MAKGLYTNAELIDSLIVDLNNVLKYQFGGQYIQSCGIISQMGQKLLNLRTAVENDIKSKNEYIENLKLELRAAGREVIEVDAHGEGAAENG